MRRLTALMTALIAVVALAACGGSSSTPSSIVSSNSSSDTPDTVSNSSAAEKSSYEKADPNESGCSATAVNIPGGITVRFTNAKKFGTLFLRRSTACQTVWGEIKGMTRSHVDVQVEALRIKPNDAAPFHTADGTPAKAVFGNMLSYRHGCVFAIAKVLPNGPTAETKPYCG